MSSLPMLSDILGQPASLEAVLAQQAGTGKAALAECGSLVRQCSGRVIVSAMGASFFAALPAVLALGTQGRCVNYAESSELLHFGQESWSSHDVAILISRSGGSIEVLELAKQLKLAGARVIGITNLPGSRLAEHADITVLIGSHPDQLIAVQSYTGTVLALLLLAEQAGGGEQTLARQCTAALPALQRHIDLGIERSEGWREFLLGPDPLYLLGRGTALAAVTEGALLFHETAKAATVGMSSGQFRHGPVEVVSRDFRAIVIGSPEQTRSLDWQLASDLRSMHAQIRWLGPLPSDTPQADVELQPWPTSLPSALMPIFDIVPLQVAAYRTALWRGIRPGAFRYASEVTENESGFPLFEASLR